MDDVSAMIDGIWLDDPLLQLESTTNFRKTLSSKMNPSTEYLIQSGVVARLVDFLVIYDSPNLQHEAAWAITNIASDKSELVVDNGAVPILVQLLASPNDDVLEQALLALGNVAASSIQNRDYVLRCGVLLPLCSKLNEDNSKLSMRKVGTRTLSHFFHDLPPSLFDKVKGALPTVERLFHSNDEQVLRDACSAVFYMSNGSEYGIQSVVEAGFIPRLVQLLKHTSPSLLCHVLSIIWFITSKDNHQIQSVIDSGALPILANLLTQDNEKIIKEACLMIININLGTVEQIQSTIDAKLIPILVNLAQNAELEIKIKAVWATYQRYLVKQSCIKPLCDLLVCENLRVVIACLDGLEKILKVGEAEMKNRGDHVNYNRQLIIDAQGQEKIENLQDKMRDHYEIKEEAVKIMETYWPEEKDKTQ